MSDVVDDVATVMDGVLIEVSDEIYFRDLGVQCLVQRDMVSWQFALDVWEEISQLS